MGEGKGGLSQLWGRGREERVSCGGGEGRKESTVGEGKEKVSCDLIDLWVTKKKAQDSLRT